MNQRPNEVVIKGSRRFRYRDRSLLLEDMRSSPQYWWWAYLRLSKDYWWICQRKGVADNPRLKETYKHFGDVYAMTFADWWESRGVGLFREQDSAAAVRQLDPYDMELSVNLDGHLILEIPLHLTERTIIRDVRKLLRHHANRQVERRSSANLQLAKFTRLRLDLVEKSHTVWRRIYETRGGEDQWRKGQVKGDKTLYQIGKELDLLPDALPAKGDTKLAAAKKVNAMKVAVSRAYTRANHLVANAVVGAFPIVESLANPIVWRPAQKRKLDEAVAAGEWRALFDESETLERPVTGRSRSAKLAAFLDQ